MRGDTRFYSSPGLTVFCGQCDKTECGRHYKNKEKYPWRYYKGYSTVGLKGYNGCCDYESPSETKKIVKKYLQIFKEEEKIKVLKSKIRNIEKNIDKLHYPWKYSKETAKIQSTEVSGLEGTKVDSGSHRMSDGFYESEFNRMWTDFILVLLLTYSL